MIKHESPGQRIALKNMKKRITQTVHCTFRAIRGN